MTETQLPTAPFGTTGHTSSRVIFGAAALGAMSAERANTVVLPQLLQHGINHIDTAASYGDSEDRVAEWMPEHRAAFFLATKTGERSGDAARAELETSLTRLGVDSVDLIQLHNLVEPEDWEQAFAPGGAVQALDQARSEGLVDHIGVTGHGLRIARMHLRSLEEFAFDSVLFPWNFSLSQIDAYANDVAELREVCATRGVAVQTIKSIARRRWQDDPEHKFSWYEPLEEPASIDRAVRWVLGQSDLFLNTSSDARRLQAAIDAAAAPQTAPPSDEDMQADVADFGITPLFDNGALERI